MTFLLDPIRQDLEERIADRVDSAKLPKSSCLVIDFDQGKINFPGIDHPLKVSLLESAKPGLFGIQSLEPETLDYVVINIQAAWLDFDELIFEVQRILKPGGELFFSTFGPDTLVEIEQAWQRVDQINHRQLLIDMHHLGDKLLKSGFIRPIVDADWIFVDYSEVEDLLADLKKDGFVNMQPDRRKTLLGKNRFQNFISALRDIAKYEDMYKVTYEIVYGYAMKTEKAQGTIHVDLPVHHSQ